VRAEGATVVYAGRRRPALLPGTVVLDDWAVLPRPLNEALAVAERLVVLDALSFPYESLDEVGWDVPMALALPSELGLDAWRALLGPPVLSRLTLDDLVIGGDDAGWERLAEEFALPRGQWLAGPADDAGLVAHVLAGAPPCLGRREEKAAFLREAAAVAEAAGRATGPSPSALVLGCGRGAWAQVLARLGYAPVGFDCDLEGLAEARRNFPGLAFREGGEPGGLAGAPEACAVALLAGGLAAQAPGHRQQVLAQAWEALRPGGSLLVLDHLAGRPGEPGRMAADEMIAAVQAAAAGEAVLDDVRARLDAGASPPGRGLLAFRRPGPEG